MLSTTNQLNAYKELTAAGGMTTPPSIEKSAGAASSATTISEQLAALVLSTLQYPATVSANTLQITEWATSLSEQSKVANSHAQLLRQHSDPSALIQLSIGWDVYCRANELPSSELPVSKAIADDVSPTKLLGALAELDISGLKTAMNSINASLAAGATGGGTGTVITDAQAKALSDAVAVFVPAMAEVITAGNTLNIVYEDALGSCNTAQNAYSNAVTVALVNASVNDCSVASAITAITPAAVLNALNGGE